MDIETNREFNERRAIDEEAIADAAPDMVQVIAHGRLSKLHAREALARDSAPTPQKAALEMIAMGGNVDVLAASGEVTRLTPNAAGLTSDRLLARAHEAAGQSSGLDR